MINIGNTVSSDSIDVDDDSQTPKRYGRFSRSVLLMSKVALPKELYDKIKKPEPSELLSNERTDTLKCLRVVPDFYL